jgi:hypothetical protein
VSDGFVTQYLEHSNGKNLTVCVRQFPIYQIVDSNLECQIDQTADDAKR